MGLICWLVPAFYIQLDFEGSTLSRSSCESDQSCEVFKEATNAMRNAHVIRFKESYME